MTINIISNQIKKTKTRGPKKVLDNTIMGLELLGISYVLNQPMEKYDYNWIQDSHVALIQASLISKPCVFGPNLAVFPKGLPFLRRKLHASSIFLFPSNWPLNVWQNLGFKECVLKTWPSGVDTVKFGVNKIINKDTILLYFKNRDHTILKNIISILKKAKLNFVLFEYGKYNETDFLKAIQRSKFGIWLGGSESQGYAISEALSCNLPFLVLDINSMGEVYTGNGKPLFSQKNLGHFKNTPVSSVPYFNEKCGVVTHNIEEFKDQLFFINKNYKSYEPRAYILENFALETSASKLLEFFSYIEPKKIVSKNNYYYTSYFIYYFQLIFKANSWKRLILKFS